MIAYVNSVGILESKPLRPVLHSGFMKEAFWPGGKIKPKGLQIYHHFRTVESKILNTNPGHEPSLCNPDRVHLLTHLP